MIPHIEAFTIILRNSNTLTSNEYAQLCIFDYWCFMDILNLGFAWASAIALCAARAAFVRSANVALGTLGLTDELSEVDSPNKSAKETISSGPILLFRTLTAKLSRDLLFSVRWLIQSLRNRCFIRSWYPSSFLSSLKCCVSEQWHDTLWIFRFLQKLIWAIHHHQKPNCLVVLCRQLPKIYV